MVQFILATSFWQIPIFIRFLYRKSLRSLAIHSMIFIMPYYHANRLTNCEKNKKWIENSNLYLFIFWLWRHHHDSWGNSTRKMWIFDNKVIIVITFEENYSFYMYFFMEVRLLTWNLEYKIFHKCKYSLSQVVLPLYIDLANAKLIKAYICLQGIYVAYRWNK